MNFHGLNAGTEENPVVIRRMWWRDPMAIDDNIWPGETIADLCRQQAGRDRALVAGGGTETEDELREWAHSLDPEELEQEDRELLDSATCWDAQAADIEQLTRELETGELAIPSHCRDLYEKVQAQRPDLEVYIEPAPVEFTDLTSDSPSMVVGPVKEISVVTQNPSGPEQTRYNVAIDPHRGNIPHAPQVTAGTIQETAHWQNWNPAFDIDEIERVDPVNGQVTGGKFISRPETQEAYATSAFISAIENMPGPHQTPDRAGIDVTTQNIVSELQQRFSKDGVPVRRDDVFSTGHTDYVGVGRYEGYYPVTVDVHSTGDVEVLTHTDDSDPQTVLRGRADELTVDQVAGAAVEGYQTHPETEPPAGKPSITHEQLAHQQALQQSANPADHGGPGLT